MKSHRPHLPLVKKRLTQIQCVCDENNLNYGLIFGFRNWHFCRYGGTKQRKWIGEKKIQVERAFPFALTEELLRRGHEITVLPEYTSMGRGQIILRDENGTLVGASEPRTDGFVAAW